MDAQLALKLSQQYYNLYVPAKLDEKKAEMLRQFNEQVIALQQSAMAAMQPPQPQPQAAPQPTPTSPLVPNGANQ